MLFSIVEHYLDILHLQTITVLRDIRKRLQAMKLP